MTDKYDDYRNYDGDTQEALKRFRQYVEEPTWEDEEMTLLQKTIAVLIWLMSRGAISFALGSIITIANIINIMLLTTLVDREFSELFRWILCAVSAVIWAVWITTTAHTVLEDLRK